MSNKKVSPLLRAPSGGLSGTRCRRISARLAPRASTASTGTLAIGTFRGEADVYFNTGISTTEHSELAKISLNLVQRRNRNLRRLRELSRDRAIPPPRCLALLQQGGCALSAAVRSLPELGLLRDDLARERGVRLPDLL